MAAGSAAARAASAGASRLARAWRALAPEQRLAATAALALLLSMVLPWYSSTKLFPVPGRNRLLTAETTHSAVSVFTFVEAAVLLTSLAVLALLLARAERRAFHLPGGDGTIVTVAGGWALLLVAWRFFDKPGFGPITTVGLAWGILGPLLASIALAYAGTRMRAAHRPEPPITIPGEPRPPSSGPPQGADRLEPPTRPTEPLDARGGRRGARTDTRPPREDEGHITTPLAAEPPAHEREVDPLTRPHGSEPPLAPDER